MPSPTIIDADALPNSHGMLAGAEKLAELEVRERQAAVEAEELASEAARLGQETRALRDSKEAAARELRESHAAVQVWNTPSCYIPGFGCVLVCGPDRSQGPKCYQQGVVHIMSRRQGSSQGLR